MAALTDAPLPAVTDLHHVRGSDLGALLEEETGVWRDTLNWDFHASAGLVQRFIDMQALNGFALTLGSRVIGYSYYVVEERKGLIGDLYVARDFATPENESHLLTAVLDGLMRTPYVRRIECQLMMLRSGGSLPLPHWRYLRACRRDFMEAELSAIRTLPPGSAANHIRIANWTERLHDEAASLIAASYSGHIDSEINDQYRSPAGARRFLMNIVQYPGCGTFFLPASYVAHENDGGRGALCGMCLSSLVAGETGHITQICVSKSVRGHGVGYELLRHALGSLAAAGCQRASLTVTAANAPAIHLYTGMGFVKRREFSAWVWEGF